MWKWVCWLWVIAPIIGFVPGTHPRMAQIGLWMLSSILVIGVGILQPKLREAHVFGWLMLATLLLVGMHPHQSQESLVWIPKVAIILSATYLIAERAQFRWLRQAVVAAAWVQIPVMLLQAVNATIPWTGAHAGLAGTTIKRGACSILLGAASLLSEERKGWILSVSSLLTGSVSGGVVILKVFWERRISRWITLSCLLISAPFWWSRLVIRFQVWMDLLSPKWNLLLGLGFRPFPLGFQDDTGNSKMAASILLRDLHSSFLDFTARFGLVGLGIIAILVAWILKRTNESWSRWFLVLAVSAGLVQSAEGFPVMTLLFLVWLIGLNEHKEDIHVHSV